MTHDISVTELIPYYPDELIGKEEYFMVQIKSFIEKVKQEREDLKDYRLKDVGFKPHDDGLLVKLYFKKDSDNDSNTNKIINFFDIRK
ncbi:hypothetical protein [Natranaerobius trueperi]|uniref:Uncharacterized protein n=1 Tax=Natranaerobius trueperi TaxID=759412 RepID=A0A226BYZ3_9FIRM|nr:hypothetical protein [Natranaerobius trueperi]OWZ83419.1 hypothetical protein CDO51_08480 [Natranaerobius trueperi]